MGVNSPTVIHEASAGSTSSATQSIFASTPTVKVSPLAETVLPDSLTLTVSVGSAPVWLKRIVATGSPSTTTFSVP